VSREPVVHIAGGGLAGSEAAWQAAALGVPVTIHEMRPVRPTAVHKTDGLAELVCSNSFRGDSLENAVGLLKEEMRRLGSLVMRAGETARVPAGGAMAVDRVKFSEAVTAAIAAHPLITVERHEVARLSELPRPLIVATGPLTSDALSRELAAVVGGSHLYFYDAISPIVLAESIDMTKVYRASRWGKDAMAKAGQRGAEVESPGDYLNCPMTEAEYAAFIDAVIAAEKTSLHAFDAPKYFEGCLPIEVMASRGRETLRFGPMKPVGLDDPRTGRWPYAVVQLRQDTIAGDHYSLVGFQTQMKWGEQARVLRMIPGLERAEFVRYGMIHRNTYINGPMVLDDTWQVRGEPGLFIAGQVSGVEGYVESAASGLIAGRNAAAFARGEALSAPPRTTAIGALGYYVSHADPAHYDPTNITFGIIAPLATSRSGALGPPPSGIDAPKRANRKALLAERALADLARWAQGSALRAPGPIIEPVVP